jgi:hypothetical protein
VDFCSLNRYQVRMKQGREGMQNIYIYIYMIIGREKCNRCDILKNALSLDDKGIQYSTVQYSTVQYSTII